MKTNAVRLLDEMGIDYELREYEVDPDDLTAESVAAKIGLPPEQVFKTLVARGDRHGVCLAVVPGNARLDLKALAKLTGDRKVETVPLKEVQPLTGYIRGGVTVLGAKKAYPCSWTRPLSCSMWFPSRPGREACRFSWHPASTFRLRAPPWDRLPTWADLLGSRFSFTAHGVEERTRTSTAGSGTGPEPGKPLISGWCLLGGDSCACQGSR